MLAFGITRGSFSLGVNEIAIFCDIASFVFSNI